MSPRYIGLDPTQIVWSNLRIKWWERVIRYTATVSFVIALIVFWAIPTAVVGVISNVKFLTQKVFFLEFLNKLPGWIMGVVSGLLPVVAMSVLMALVPIIMRRELRPAISLSLFFILIFFSPLIPLLANS